MDRRSFIKTVLSSSLVVPLAAASKAASPTRALYVIGDAPQTLLPELLAGIGQTGRGRSCAISENGPVSENVRAALAEKGWSFIPLSRKADVRVSFALLRSACAPSFALIQNGRVIDIRARRLQGLWREISLSGPRSSLLTVVAFSGGGPSSSDGSRAALYLDGKKKDILDLGRDASRTYESGGGFVAVAVEGGAVRVSDSSCRHRICACSGPVSSGGQRIICAPNRFLLEVEGRSAVDSIIG